jgi:hypothetical protein
MEKPVKDSGQAVEQEDEYADGEIPMRPRRISQSMSRSVRGGGDTGISGSLGRAGSYSLFGGSNPLEAAAMGSTNRADDDEEALRWAALEKLPTYDRVRTSILQKHTGSIRQVDVQKDLSMDDIHHLLHKLHRTTGEDEQLLVKLRKRLDRYVCICVGSACLWNHPAMKQFKRSFRL